VTSTNNERSRQLVHAAAKAAAAAMRERGLTDEEADERCERAKRLNVFWLLMFFVFDRTTYIIFTRGRMRVRKFIGEGEKVFDVRGMVLKRHRDDLFRHWLIGFGTADLTVFTSGANTQQIEMRNVLGIGAKMDLINTMLQELEVTKGS
jgi:hypothetical protein